jgi:hypothetical protein
LKRHAVRIILEHVASWRKPGFPVWAAWFVCLPAVLHAFPGDGSQVHTVSIPVSVAPAKVEFQVTYGSLPGGWATSATSLGGWEVTVAFDAAHCVIHCTYRRTRDALLLQPITSIRISNGGQGPGPGGQPTTVTVDPAGLTFPSIASLAMICPEEFGLPGRRWAAAMLVPDRQGRAPASIHAADGLSATHSLAAITPALPLRI